MALGQIAADAAPGPAAVRAAQDVGGEVAMLVVVNNHIDRVRVVQIGFDVVDEVLARHARQASAEAPVLAAVFADLDAPVIGSRVEQPLHDRGFRQGRDGMELGHGRQVPGRVEAPGATHERVFEPGLCIWRAGEVRAHDLPGVTAVVTAPHAVAAVIEACRVMRTDQDRRVPVEALP